MEVLELSKMSDLDLAGLQGKLYNQLMQTQNNLLSLSNEIERRKLVLNKSVEEVKPEEVK